MLNYLTAENCHVRYFKRTENLNKIRSYIETCSRGDWFVLYEMSKNLNGPFFIDFLTTLSRVMEQQKSNPEEGTTLLREI